MTHQHRFIPNTEDDKKELLAACGVSNFEELLVGIPAAVRFPGKLNIDKGLSEHEIRRRVRELSKESRYTGHHLSFIGAGIYDHFCPSAVNQLTLRGEFLTSYTPYQPEMSQGTLQALFEFQTMVAELFDMPISNASHYDGSTSLAEAALMSLRMHKDKNRVLVSGGVHPEYIEVLKTYLHNLGVEVTVVPVTEDGKTSAIALKSLLSENVSAVLIQSPNFFGCIEDQETLCSITKAADATFVSSVTEMLSLGVLNAPGYYGADIATGEGQSLGLPPSFGGPFVGLFTTRSEFVRQMPGRLCGETLDAKGRRSYTLTLSTREQHIRREKATSNICTNQNLMALWATIWLSMIGKVGFQELAEQNLAKTEYAKDQVLRSGKAKLRFAKTQTFNEFVIDIPSGAEAFSKAAIARGMAPGLVLQRFVPSDKTGLLVAVTEKKSKDDIDLLCSLIKELC
jgi:glycine dehydrogenase subunit 1